MARYSDVDGSTFETAVTLQGALASTAAVTTTQGVASGTALTVGGRAASASGGTAVSNTTTETASRTHSIPASTLTEGKVLRCTWAARISAANSTDTFTFRLRLGGVSGTVLVKSTAVDGSAGMVCTGHFMLTAAAAPGATVSVCGAGAISDWAAQGAGGLPGAGAMYPAYLPPTNFATNGALSLVATIEESVANAGNSAVVEMFAVELI